MRKLIVSAFLISFALLSCSKHEGEETQINTSDLPASVNAYISNNYPAETIYEAYSAHGKDMKYLVVLSSDEELYFDHNGTFTREGDPFYGHHHHKGHHGIGPIHSGIPVDSLAAAITSYISTNFAGSRILHAETDSLCSVGMVTEVMIIKDGGTPLKLYFSKNEAYLMQGNRLLSSDLPQAVKTTISNNYPGYQMTFRSEKYLLSDNYTVEYFLYLYNGTTHKRVVLKEDGSEVCSQ